MPGFNRKNEVNQTERYQKIKNILTSKTALAYISLIVHLCQDFKESIVPLQSKEPNIHVLYTKCVKFVKYLLSRFVKNDSFMKQMKMQEKIQAISQEEKCKVYHWYFYIPDIFLFYIFTNTISVLIFENLFPSFSFPPSYNMIQSNIFSY